MIARFQSFFLIIFRYDFPPKKKEPLQSFLLIILCLFDIHTRRGCSPQKQATFSFCVYVDGYKDTYTHTPSLKHNKSAGIDKFFFCSPAFFQLLALSSVIDIEEHRSSGMSASIHVEKL